MIHIDLKIDNEDALELLRQLRGVRDPQGLDDLLREIDKGLRDVVNTQKKMEERQQRLEAQIAQNMENIHRLAKDDDVEVTIEDGPTEERQKLRRTYGKKTQEKLLSILKDRKGKWVRVSDLAWMMNVANSTLRTHVKNLGSSEDIQRKRGFVKLRK